MACPTIADGRFVLERRLGEGGQAIVFAAHDRRLGVQRALKVLLPLHAYRPVTRERFESEARAMAVLEHPNVVRIYDVNIDRALPFLIMELVSGASLARRVELKGVLPAGMAVLATMQICEGTAAAHRAGLVHRDIKPQNVLVARDGTCKLTDFGVARTESGHRTKGGQALGTEGYMAPEQQSNARQIDARADIFSIGMTLFVLMTKRHPSECSARQLHKTVPEALRPILERATARAPEDRYADAHELALALEETLGVLPSDPPTPPLWCEPTLPEPLDNPWAEIQVLLDPVAKPPAPKPPAARPAPTGSPAPSAPAARTSGVLATVSGYSMSRPAPTRSEATPDWVDRSSLSSRPRQLVVGLDEQEKRMSSVARARREQHQEQSTAAELRLVPPPPEEAEELPRDAWRALLALVGRPLRMLTLPMLLLLLLVMAYTLSLQVRHHHAGRSVEQSRVALYASMDRERSVIEELGVLGADRARLEALYVRWMSASEPERSLLAVTFIQEVEGAARLHAMPGSATWEQVNERLALLGPQGAKLEESLRTQAGLRGCLGR
jgi:serine/threonine protein kinase